MKKSLENNNGIDASGAKHSDDEGVDEETNGVDHENENDEEMSFGGANVTTTSSPNKSKLSASMMGARFELNYSAEDTFENRFVATKYIDSLGVWKFERNRPTKKGSKGFYHCKISDSCKSKIYLLSQPNCDQVTLFRNNIEHDHSGGGQVGAANVTQTRTINKTVMPNGQLRENQNSVNYFNQSDSGPMKYFINNANVDDENEDMYGSDENMNQSLDGSENFFGGHNYNNEHGHTQNGHENGGGEEAGYFDDDSDEMNAGLRRWFHSFCPNLDLEKTTTVP